MPSPRQTIPRFEQIDAPIRHAEKRECSSGISRPSERSVRRSMETLDALGLSASVLSVEYGLAGQTESIDTRRIGR
jgi:hypothetical protein